jgi:uncharacterized membrane protein YbhN (UPF0104 family)
LATHWDQLGALLELTASQLFWMYFLTLLTKVVWALTVRQILGVLDTKTKFLDIFWLQNAASLLNFAPMKFGTLFQANYLKRHYGLPYTHFAGFFLYATFLMVATATSVGLAVLIGVYGLEGYESKILALVFAASATGSLALLFVPLPQPKGKGRLSTILRGFLGSRVQICKEAKTILVSAALLIMNFLLYAGRIGIIYHSMGKDLHPCGYLVLGGLGFVVLFIGLTPGGLGVREIVLPSGAVALGIPFEVGVLAALIDRAIDTSYLFVVGGACALWLWRKSPADFKSREMGELNQA